MKNPLLICISIVLSIATSPAQDGRKVSFRTLCLEQVKGLESVVIPAASADQSQKVQLYTDVSPVIEGVFKTNDASFFIEKSGPDGKPQRELVGKAPLGKSNRQLFVFRAAGGGEGTLPYTVTSYDDDTQSFGMGNVRAINLAPVPVRFVISGATTPQIPPGKFAQFPHSKKVNDYNMYPVVVEFLNGNGQWIKGQSVSWKATDRRREIVVTLIDSRFKQPVVRMYTDFPPWMEPPVAPPND